MTDQMSQLIVQHSDRGLGMDEVFSPDQLSPHPCVEDDVKNGLTSPMNLSLSQDVLLGAAINEAILSSPLFSSIINPPGPL